MTDHLGQSGVSVTLTKEEWHRILTVADTGVGALTTMNDEWLACVMDTITKLERQVVASDG